ncbi:hypothetical protein [Exiguobacterium sp. s196]|uniref:hypothetical protein n=1 Tax=Exiguobacterium sp. s196 TaxID=2751283 RepID=UPI001BEAB537|nr:hypothetical protein [Exiguobacterium sp. s196]
MRKVLPEDLDFNESQPYFVLYLMTNRFQVGDDLDINLFMIWTGQKHREFREVLGMTERDVKLKMRHDDYVTRFIGWLKTFVPTIEPEEKQLTLFLEGE